MMSQFKKLPRGRFASSAARQSGTALIVSLIILAVVTILGVTSMQSSNTELKLAASQRDRGVAFEAAEAALAIVEKNLADDPPQREKLFSTCTGTGCYNKTCTGGLCFEGKYLNSDSEYGCEVTNYSTTTRRVNFWSDPTLKVWENANRHQTLKVDSLKTDVKYLVEFLCFVPRDKETAFSDVVGENTTGAPLFRITALAEGNGGRAAVALQSTYKVLNGH
jgi:type IV pilus assembly protein PilX